MSSPPSAPRVAIVGARRARQGLGPFMARHLRRAGAEVVAHWGTSAASAEAATRELAEIGGVTSRPFSDAETMLAETRPDALIVLAPSDHHDPWLQLALDRRLHALCEKPLLWGGADDVDRARTLVTGFSQAGLLLEENTQWPATIPAWRALFPQAPATPPRRFVMRLSPTRTGEDMLGDALPHPLSLLQELAPEGDEPVTDVRFSSTAPDATGLTVHFTWPARSGPVAATVELELGPEQPREAGWGVDDHHARRLIRTEDYAQFFASGARLVDLPDPLEAHVASFVGRLDARLRGDAAASRQAEPGVAERRMVRRMEHLATLLAVYRSSGP